MSVHLKMKGQCSVQDVDIPKLGVQKQHLSQRITIYYNILQCITIIAIGR